MRLVFWFGVNPDISLCTTFFVKKVKVLFVKGFAIAEAKVGITTGFENRAGCG